MSEKWFISDTHFGHRAIIKYSAKDRPFETIEEHDEKLIENWNSVVRMDDKVYHMGDFCLNRTALQVAKRLNGRKILVMGNHDTFRTEEYLEVGFERVHGALQFENMMLTHVPIHPQQLEHRFFVNVHGHLHSHKIMTYVTVDTAIGPIEERITDWRYLNVGVEHTSLKPLTLDEVYSRIMIAKGEADA